MDEIQRTKQKIIDALIDHEDELEALVDKVDSTVESSVQRHKDFLAALHRQYNIEEGEETIVPPEMISRLREEEQRIKTDLKTELDKIIAEVSKKYSTPSK